MELYRHVDNCTRLEPTLWRARLLKVSVGREVFSCPTAVSPSPWCSRRRQSLGRFSTIFPRVVHLRLGIFSQSISINLCDIGDIKMTPQEFLTFSRKLGIFAELRVLRSWPSFASSSGVGRMDTKRHQIFRR